MAVLRAQVPFTSVLLLLLLVSVLAVSIEATSGHISATTTTSPATDTSPVSVATTTPTSPTTTTTSPTTTTTSPTTTTTSPTTDTSPAATTEATPTSTMAALTALTAVMRIVGDDVWPFDNTAIDELTEALAASMTTITASDINTISAVQTSSNSSRRLLSSSSADVTTQLNAGSTGAVSTVATDLAKVVSGGTLLTSLKSNGVTATSVAIVSSVAAAKITQTSTCANGAINGICIGSSSTSTGLSSGAIIAIACVGGIVLLILAVIVFCCCRMRWRSRAAAVEAAVVAKGQPEKQPMTPTMPEPFAVNYPQFSGQKSLPARTGSYIPPRTISKGKSGAGSTNLSAIAASNAASNPTTVKE